MKKILFAMAVLFGCTTVSFAQNNLVATLQHEGQFTHFYGQSGLQSAYNAATDGDIITLSAGTFNSPGTINKGITLRGTGIDADAMSYVNNYTYISATDVNRVITIEGIVFSNDVYVYNNASGNGQGEIRFIKNRIRGFEVVAASSYSTEKGPVIRVYNSVLYGFTIKQNAYPDLFIYNSDVANPSNNFGPTTCAFINCSIHNALNCSNLNFYNCLFYYDYANNYTLSNTAVCYYCLCVGGNSLFNYIISGGNNMYASTSQVWNDGNIQLGMSDEAKATYLGSDGTEVGTTGGKYPFTYKVQYPVITSFSSDVQTSKQGILNINVEVDGK